MISPFFGGLAGNAYLLYLAVILESVYEFSLLGAFFVIGGILLLNASIYTLTHSPFWSPSSFLKEPLRILATILIVLAGSIFCQVQKEEILKQKETLKNLQERIKQLSVLGKIVGTERFLFDFYALLNFILSPVKEALRAETLIISLREGDTLVHQVVIGKGKETLERKRMKINHNLPSLTIKKEKTLRVEPKNLTQFSRELKCFSFLNPNTVISAPIKSEEGIIGVVTAINKEERKIFSPDDAEFLGIATHHFRAMIKESILRQELHQKINELTAMSQIAQVTTSTLKLVDLLNQVLQVLIKLFDASSGSIMLVEKGLLKIRAAHGLHPSIVKRARRKLGEGISGYVAQERKSLLLTNPLEESKLKGVKESIRDSVIAPLEARENVVGVVCLNNENGKNRFTSEHLRLLEALSNQIAIAVENARIYELTQRKSVTDQLTELYNHAYFWERLNEEIERAKRHSHHLSLIMIDIDDFKKYNDLFGHLKGDDSLRTLSQILKTQIRKSDIAARYGGEEFAIILPETSMKKAFVLAERVRKAVEENKDKFLSPLTISLGVATFPTSAQDAKSLLQQSDFALYDAKKSGKNKVCSKK